MSVSKKNRQHQIAQILAAESIANQAELIEKLADHEIDATQATVSRDLEEMGAIKIRVTAGETIYAIPDLPTNQIVPTDHLQRVLGDWVLELHRSGDLVVLRTPPGCAHVVAAALDRSGLRNLIGTVAGDDTVLSIATEKQGVDVAEQMASLAGLDQENIKK